MTTVLRESRAVFLKSTRASSLERLANAAGPTSKRDGERRTTVQIESRDEPAAQPLLASWKIRRSSRV